MKPLFVLFLLLSCTIQAQKVNGQTSTRTTSKKALQQKRYNVLFLSIDDLRPELNCYGVSAVKSPNIDRIAANGLMLNHAYCQQALCGPSRASVLTSLRPDSLKIYDLTSSVRKNVPDVLTLPGYFKQQGYFTASFSKIFHINDPESWSTPAWTSGKPLYALQESLDAFITTNNRRYGPIFEAADLPDNTYIDGNTAEEAIRVLKEVKDKPFFLAVGFFKPHLPFVAPKKYWDMYDPASFVMTKDTIAPHIPAIAQFGAGTGELRQYAGVPKQGAFSPEMKRKLMHGYYASISYMDAQVGKVLDELKRQGLDQNTIVVLWGDHGWKLGEYAHWGKRDNMETDLRAPVIISSPLIKGGTKSNALVELIDLYPTICEAAGLAIPEGLQGRSFYTLMKKPNWDFKKAAFSQNIRGGGVMGYSMRTKRYRYTEYHQKGIDGAQGMELYDEQKDPGETVNVSADPAYEKVMQHMQQLLHKYGKNGFRLEPPMQ